MIDEYKINILKILFSVENMETEQIAQNMNSQLQFSKFHLEELQKLKMVKALKIQKQKTEPSSSITITTTYSEVDGYQIEQEGRKYLIDNNLLSA
jgi:phosphopantothenoylcysteine synthetase/decarboxylase